jgi:hypothetical protein
MKRVSFYLMIVFVLTSLTSCSRPYLIKEEPKFRPNEGKALVNFVRPSYSGYVGATTKIWDSDKLIIISDRGEEWYQYECEPGKHLFVSWSEYKSPVEAELLPGRVYYIVLRKRLGFFRLRIHQVPVNKEHPLWEQVLGWQQSLPSYAFDQQKLATSEAKDKAKILEYLKNYEDEVKGTKHVLYLRPEDGVPID